MTEEPSSSSLFVPGVRHGGQRFRMHLGIWETTKAGTDMLAPVPKEHPSIIVPIEHIRRHVMVSKIDCGFQHIRVRKCGFEPASCPARPWESLELFIINTISRIELKQTLSAPYGSNHIDPSMSKLSAHPQLHPSCHETPRRAFDFESKEDLSGYLHTYILQGAILISLST